MILLTKKCLRLGHKHGGFPSLEALDITQKLRRDLVWTHLKLRPLVTLSMLRNWSFGNSSRFVRRPQDQDPSTARLFSSPVSLTAPQTQRQFSTRMRTAKRKSATLSSLPVPRLLDELGEQYALSTLISFSPLKHGALSSPRLQTRAAPAF